MSNPDVIIGIGEAAAVHEAVVLRGIDVSRAAGSIRASNSGSESYTWPAIMSLTALANSELSLMPAPRQR